MPITGSGQIALIADIEAEFDQTGTTDISLEQARDDAGLSAGQVSMTDFYGLSDIQTATVHWAVIAGGGSGTGGGAGGYRTSYGTSGGNSSSESTFTIATGNTYTITVGGESGDSSISGGGNNGGTSVSITSTAGGNFSAGSGGSGAGAYAYTSNNSYISRGGGSGTTGQGHSGGSLYIRRGPYYGGGGGAGGSGGGASGGQNTFSTVLGGGSGITSDITGSSIEYARGAGNNTLSIANRGHGRNSGTVIIRMPSSIYSSVTKSGSTSVTTSGSNTIIQFTGSGSFSL